MKLNRTVKDLLKRAGATLKRSKKHLVFGLPDGKNVVLSHTPSDGNAVHNQIRDIKQHLGVPKPEPKERKPRVVKPGRAGEAKEKIVPVEAKPSLRDQLRVLGVTEAALRSEITALLDGNAVLSIRIDSLQASNDSLVELRKRCWLCRLRDWWIRRRSGVSQ